jgi:poly-beta-1,6-N-acetyl-D-glucosamine synthase
MSHLLLITPAHNEAAHLERTIEAVAAQTHPPDLWLIVDDCSTDETAEIARRFAHELPFVEILQTPPHSEESGADRLTLAAEARAFNLALASVELDDFTHLGKLDADVELPPDYFLELLERFDERPQLGIGGGVLLEQGRDGDWRRTSIPDYHVRGALKLYSRECFAAIGGIEERLGWDTIDETYARMRGYETLSFAAVRAKHHRPVGTANGTLRGRARHGQCAYILRYGFPWVLARSFKVALQRPVGISGAAFLYGYLRAFLRSDPKVEDEGFKRFVRRELRSRIFRNRPFFTPSVRTDSGITDVDWLQARLPVCGRGGHRCLK